MQRYLSRFVVIRVSDYYYSVHIKRKFIASAFLFMVSTVSKGKKSEDMVASFLISQGYSILSRNFRSQMGEIDIIACKNNSISFVEVKKMVRNWQISDISNKVNYSKQFKIKATASYYLAHIKDIKYDLISFDVAAVNGSKIDYFKGAF